MRGTQLRVSPELRHLRLAVGTKVSVFGTRAGAPRSAANGEHAEAHSRTGEAVLSRAPAIADVTGNGRSVGGRDPSQSLGTAASKGGRGFRKNQFERCKQLGRAGRKVRRAIKPGSPKQSGRRERRSRTRSLRARFRRKVSVFGTHGTVREKPRTTSLQTIRRAASERAMR